MGKHFKKIQGRPSIIKPSDGLKNPFGQTQNGLGDGGHPQQRTQQRTQVLRAGRNLLMISLLAIRNSSECPKSVPQSNNCKLYEYI